MSRGGHFAAMEEPQLLVEGVSSLTNNGFKTRLRRVSWKFRTSHELRRDQTGASLYPWFALVSAKTDTSGNRVNLIRTKLYYENNDLQRPWWNLRSEADDRFLG
jgi:hypothetical protein